MAILSALGLAQLQTMQHLLTELEGEGVQTLAEARVRVASEFAKESGRRRRVRSAAVPLPNPVAICPYCHTPLAPVILSAKESVLGCRKCRYSRFVE